MTKKSSVQPDPVSPVQTQDLTNSQDSQNAANSTLSTESQALSPYLAGSNGMSQFRTALTGSLASSTANTGDNAMAAIKQRAQAAGMGSDSQPITMGAENQETDQQAGRVAQIPSEVEQQAAPLELQAAGEEQGIANTENSSAQGYNNSGNQLAYQNQQDYENQLQQQRQQKAGIWGALAKAGLTAATALA